MLGRDMMVEKLKMRPQRKLAWIWLLCCMGALLLLPSCHRAVTETRTMGKICTWDVPAGEKYIFQDVPTGVDTVDFKARVYRASHDATCTTFDDQAHPLVIVAHGRVMAGVPNNYLGMTYLTHHLASWGDIVVSVNLDVVNALQGAETQWGIPHRGELVLHAVEYMIAQNRTLGSPFYHRIDTTKIALVGHSRGGGAVVYAANYNELHRKRPIKAIATLSPANFGTRPLHAAVPHICLYGTWDGDLYEGQGPDIWSRGTRKAPRELVEIYGANHYYFTDNACFEPEKSEISRAAHHLLADGMVNAWLDRYLRGLDRYYWSSYLMGETRLGQQLEYYVSFQDADYLPIQKENPVAYAGSKELGGKIGRKIAAKKECELTDVALCGPPDYCVGAAMRGGWDGRKERFDFVFEPMDASAYSHLCFRMSQVHGDSLNLIDHKKDFHVLVTDGNGHSAKARLSDYLGGLQYPDLSGSLPPDDPNNRKQIMRGFRIPKYDFKGLDFSKIVAVRFVFDRPASKDYDNKSGTIKLTDLEFSN
jgi:hypothetical protein